VNLLRGERLIEKYIKEELRKTDGKNVNYGELNHEGSS
jgi:hypothetical protein